MHLVVCFCSVLLSFLKDPEKISGFLLKKKKKSFVFNKFIVGVIERQ